VCVLYSLEGHCVCTVQSRGTLCVYCTVYRGTVCVLHSVEGHCVCTVQSREAVHIRTMRKYANIITTTSISTDTIEPLP